MPLDVVVYTHPHINPSWSFPTDYFSCFYPQYPGYVFLRYRRPSTATSRVWIYFSDYEGHSYNLVNAGPYDDYHDIHSTLPEEIFNALPNSKAINLHVKSYYINDNGEEELQEDITRSMVPGGYYAESKVNTPDISFSASPAYTLPGDTVSIYFDITTSEENPGHPLIFQTAYTFTRRGHDLPFQGWSWGCPLIYDAETATWNNLSEAVTAGWMANGTTHHSEPTPNRMRHAVTLVANKPGNYSIELYYTRFPSEEDLTGGMTYNSIHLEAPAMAGFVVHSPLSCGAEIRTIIPTEYQEGNDDPLAGTPPYTVTLADTSTMTSNTIPVSTVVIDWGDPDSGTLNTTTLTDVGANLFADQTHTYSGYGPYTIRVTWTDVRGNVSEATVYFEADVTPRLIKPPELTPVTGYQPLLITGRAHVAGNPIPTVTWAYSLQDGDYTGSKDGEYIDLSLLAAGTYDISCTTIDNGVIIDETTWEVVVEPKPIYPDNPVAANDLDIWVFQDGERVDLIQPQDVQYTDRHAHPSYCEFTVPKDYPFAEALLPGGEIAVGYQGAAVLCRVESYSENEDGSISITAQDAASVALQSRVATVATRSTIGNGYDCQTAPAEALIRYFAEANLGLTADEAARAIPRMRVVEECQNRGGQYTYSARYEDVLSIVEDICASSGLGWRSTLQSDADTIFSLAVVAGANRTIDSDTPVLFSGRPGSAHTARVGAYAAYARPNCAITAGAGDGDTREYTTYGDTEATDLARRELFVDAGDAADAAEMARIGELNLLKQEDKNIVVYPGEQYQLGRDYNTGDFVSVMTNSGILLRSLQIIQTRLSRDSTGVHIELECGSDLRGYQRLLREQTLANTYARK